MKEHYATRLKRELAQARKERAVLVEGCKKIALGKSLDAKKTAHETLKSAGLLPTHMSVDCPPDRIYMFAGGFGDRFPDNNITDYI